MGEIEELLRILDGCANGSTFPGEFVSTPSACFKAAACIRELVQEVGALETTIDLMKMEIS